jgi:Reverse transcriptase (RNA-dependent DNA polymerase)
MLKQVLAKYLKKGVVVYLDDILIFSKSMEEHLQLIDSVLPTLISKKLRGKRTKCEFMSKQITYLGLEISRDGICYKRDLFEYISNWKLQTQRSNYKGF